MKVTSCVKLEGEGRPNLQTSIISQPWEIRAFEERFSESPKCTNELCPKCHITLKVSVAWRNEDNSKITGEIKFFNNELVDSEDVLESSLTVQMNFRWSSKDIPEYESCVFYILSPDLWKEDDVMIVGTSEGTKTINQLDHTHTTQHSICLTNIMSSQLLRNNQPDSLLDSAGVLHGKLEFLFKKDALTANPKFLVQDRKKFKNEYYWTNSSHADYNMKIKIGSERFYFNREKFEGKTHYLNQFPIRKDSQSSRIVVTGVSPIAMKIILDKIYNGAFCETYFDHLVLDVYKLTHVLQYQYWVSKCAEKILTNLTSENVSEILVLSYDYPHEDFHAKAYQFYQKHVILVVKTKEHIKWYNEEPLAFLAPCDPASVPNKPRSVIFAEDTDDLGSANNSPVSNDMSDSDDDDAEPIIRVKTDIFCNLDDSTDDFISDDIGSLVSPTAINQHSVSTSEDSTAATRSDIPTNYEDNSACTQKYMCAISPKRINQREYSSSAALNLQKIPSSIISVRENAAASANTLLTNTIMVDSIQSSVPTSMEEKKRKLDITKSGTDDPETSQPQKVKVQRGSSSGNESEANPINRGNVPQESKEKEDRDSKLQAGHSRAKPISFSIRSLDATKALLLPNPLDESPSASPEPKNTTTLRCYPGKPLYDKDVCLDNKPFDKSKSAASKRPAAMMVPRQLLTSCGSLSGSSRFSDPSSRSSSPISVRASRGNAGKHQQCSSTSTDPLNRTLTAMESANKVSTPVSQNFNSNNDVTSARLDWDGLARPTNSTLVKPPVASLRPTSSSEELKRKLALRVFRYFKERPRIFYGILRPDTLQVLKIICREEGAKLDVHSTFEFFPCRNGTRRSGTQKWVTRIKVEDFLSCEEVHNNLPGAMNACVCKAFKMISEWLSLEERRTLDFSDQLFQGYVPISFTKNNR